MKNIIKRTLATIMVVLMLLTSAPLQGFVELEWPEIDFSGVGDWFGTKASAAEATTTYQVGDIIEFGSYPQSKVTDSAIISALNSAGGKWVSYNYYTGTGSYSDGKMTASDYMRYKDVIYGSDKYRGVIFDSYRPYLTCYTSSTSNTYQDDNGYKINTVYWFKYETIKWRVIDPLTGLIMSETIIDSQPYNNTVYIYDQNYFNDSSYTTYASDYKASSIRKWLNNDFYNTSFTDSEKNKIGITALNNDSFHTLIGNTDHKKYDSDETKDKIFLLSFSDVTNSNYGFDSKKTGKDEARYAKGSDYAQSQGLFVYEPSAGGDYGESNWLLRTPDASGHCCYVSYLSFPHNATAVMYTEKGIRPALTLNLTESATMTIQDKTDIYLGDPGEGKADDSNSIHVLYKGDDAESFDASKVKFTVADSSIAEIKNIKTVKFFKDSVNIYADVITKKLGETEVTVSYNNVSASGKLNVKKPNNLKFEIENPNLKYCEVDGVFFDDSNYLSKDGISLKMKYSNVFKEGVKYSVTDFEILKQLKFEDAKIVFEIEEGEGLSFENVKTVTTKEIKIEDFELLEKEEDKLKIFCTDSDALGKFNAVKAKIKYSVMLYENGEYIEKTSDYISFEVQSYKRHYINEHAYAMIEEDKFRNVMASGFAKQMLGLEDEADFKVMQFLNDSLIKNLADLMGPLDEVQAYHLAVANLISTMRYDIEGSVSEAIAEKSLNTASQIMEIFLEVAENQFAPGMKEVISQLCPEAILNHLNGLKQIGELDELSERVLTDSYYKTKLIKVMGGTEKVNKICKSGGILLNTAKDIRTVFLVNSALDSIERMLDEQRNVLEEIRKKALSKGERDLAAVLSAYTTNKSGVTEILIKSCVDTILMSNVDSVFTAVSMFAGKAVKEAIADKITSVLGEKVFSVASSAFGTLMFAYEYGRLVTDLVFNNSDYAQASLMIVMAGHMSESLFDVIMEYYELMLKETDLDKAFEYAKSLDYAFNMYKQIELIACDSTIEALKARETSSAVRLFLKNTGEKYTETISKINVLKTKISGAYCHDLCLANIYAEVVGFDKIDIDRISASRDDSYTDYKTLCVQCPVDVFVKDSKGNTVASVENNLVTKEADGIGIVVIDDEKFICLPSTEEYDVEIVATDEGTMDYTVFEYGKESVDNVRSVSYEKIPLVKNKEFTAKLDTEKFTDKDNYNLSTGSQTITATSDDYVPVTAISLSADKNTAYVGNEITLSVATTPENASPETYKWTSSDESIATVSGGIVKGVKVGTATITCEVKSNSKIKASFTVSIKNCSHSFSAWETVEESTCNEYGYKKRSCSICNAVGTEKLTELKAHEPESEGYELPASCTKNAATVTLCKNCGEICNKVEKEETATGHKLGSMTVDKKASTENSGSQSQTCGTCGAKVNKTKIPRVIAPKISSDVYTFDGKSKTPRVNIYDYDGNKLTEGKDYTLKYSSGRTYPGSYKVKISYTGKYEGTQTIPFKIAMKDTAVKSVAQSTTAIKLTWSAVPGATGYRVYQYSPSKKKYVVIASIKGKTSYTKSKNLKAGSQYKFKIKPYVKLSDGTVIWGDASSAFTTATQPKAPTKVTATTTKSTISLKWSASAGATGYRVYQYSPSKGKYVVIESLKGKTSYKKSKSLKANSTYKFKIKPYVKLADGTVIWGSASGAFAFKTKS